MNKIDKCLIRLIQEKKKILRSNIGNEEDIRQDVADIIRIKQSYSKLLSKK